MANKHSIMTREMVESFCNSYYIPDEVHPTAPGRDMTITQFPEGKVGVYTRVFPIFVPLYTGGVLEKDPAPHLTARQEHAVQVLSSNKAPFRRYPECFLALVGLSPYYPFCENTYPDFERPDRTDMGLLDYIRTADPRKVQAVEVQKGKEHVTLLDSIKHCFVSLDAPAAVQQASGSGSGAGPEVSAPSAGENVVAEENVIPEMRSRSRRREGRGQGGKSCQKQGDTLPAKDEDKIILALLLGTGGRHFVSLRRTIRKAPLLLGSFILQRSVHPNLLTMRRFTRLRMLTVYNAADTVNFQQGVGLYSFDGIITNDSLLVTDFLFVIFLTGFSSFSLLGDRGMTVAEIARLKSLGDRDDGEGVLQRNYCISIYNDPPRREDLRLSFLLRSFAFRDFKEKMETQQEATVCAGVVQSSWRTCGHVFWVLPRPGPRLCDIARGYGAPGMSWRLREPLPLAWDSNSETVSKEIRVWLSSWIFFLEGTFGSVFLKLLSSWPCLEHDLSPLSIDDRGKKLQQLLCQFNVDIVSHPLSSQNLLGEASTSAVTPRVEDLDTDEDLGSVVCMPQLEDPRFEILS
ncbi:hypothetical protein Tco_0456058 [Tanacetum coccineum]